VITLKGSDRSYFVFVNWSFEFGDVGWMNPMSFAIEVVGLDFEAIFLAEFVGDLVSLLILKAPTFTLYI
jgi:hypothetical protein